MTILYGSAIFVPLVAAANDRPAPSYWAADPVIQAMVEQHEHGGLPEPADITESADDADAMR